MSPLEFNSYGARRGHHEVLIRGHVRQHPAAQRAGRRGRGAVHASTCPTARRASSTTSRCATATEGVPLDRRRRQGVRLRLVARLGREGPAAARRPRGDRRDVRADPPHQPRRAWASCRSSSCRARTSPRSGLTGRESFTIRGVEGASTPRSRLQVVARADDGREPHVRGDLPHRRPDRARLLPQRRHPAGGRAAARARGRRALPAQLPH